MGFGRIVALHYRSSTFMPDSVRDSVPLYLKRQCDRTLGGGMGEEVQLSLAGYAQDTSAELAPW